MDHGTPINVPAGWGPWSLAHFVVVLVAGLGTDVLAAVVANPPPWWTSLAVTAIAASPALAKQAVHVWLVRRADRVKALEDEVKRLRAKLDVSCD
jgi:hypothetical protein